MTNQETGTSGPQAKETASIEDFGKFDIRIGKILAAEKVPDAQKLVRLLVDAGESSPRSIISGIAEHYPDPGVLVGKSVPVLLNLPWRLIRGNESQGMVLYAVSNEKLTTLEPHHDMPPGTAVR